MLIGLVTESRAPVPYIALVLLGLGSRKVGKSLIELIAFARQTAIWTGADRVIPSVSPNRRRPSSSISSNCGR